MSKCLATCLCWAHLQVLSTEGFDPVPTQLLRKYIAYARKYVHPHLSSDAADVIQVYLIILSLYLYALQNITYLYKYVNKESCFKLLTCNLGKFPSFPWAS